MVWLKDEALLQFFGTLKVHPTVMFVVCLLFSGVIVTLLYQLRLRKYHGENALGAWCTLVAALLLGTVCAKLVYVLTSFQFGQILNFTSPEYFSLWGGALGVCIAVAIGSIPCRVKPIEALDAFAPCGALMLCLTRLAEYFLNPMLKMRNVTLIGICDQLTDNALWHVCFLEADLALLIAVIALLRKKHAFVRTIYWLMTCQILTELLHCYSLRLGGLVFVRIEQILCAISMAVILFLHGRRGLDISAGKRFAPIALFLIPVGVIVYAEFELDKGWLNEALWNMFMNPETYEVPAWVESVYYAHSWIWYGVIALCAGFMLLLERIMVRRRADMRSRV